MNGTRTSLRISEVSDFWSLRLKSRKWEQFCSVTAMRTTDSSCHKEQMPALEHQKQGSTIINSISEREDGGDKVTLI